jgi:hypothetical protein
MISSSVFLSSFIENFAFIIICSHLDCHVGAKSLCDLFSGCCLVKKFPFGLALGIAVDDRANRGNPVPVEEGMGDVRDEDGGDV